MSIPLANIHFEDFPIEFKQINPSDFSEEYNVEEKIVITPNDEGYISDVIEPIFEEGFATKNTVVINAGVGQGKSRAIINLIEKYANRAEYIVMVAVPYKNLIDQYVEDISNKIGYRKVFDLLDIDNVNLGDDTFFKSGKNIFEVNDTDFINQIKISDYKVHVLTTNALLGNAGDTSLLQSKRRAIYFGKLKAYCEKANKKLIWIFDEIHDSIHNFKEEYLFGLWKYQGLIQKTFVISATFNESSKEVIKYLSEFTDRNIQIIESERIRRPFKQSRLHINFYSGYTVEHDERLISLLRELLKEKKYFDMMVYSKNLIKKFLSKPDINSKYLKVQNILYPINEKINRCYSDIFDKERANKKYDKESINIGTNFSTGVNIEKDDHNFIIVFPKEVTIEYFNNKGVFTSGANAIIQSIARQRKQGDIYIFLPRPPYINVNSMNCEEDLKQIITSVFSDLSFGNMGEVHYTNINKQSDELEKIYRTLYNNVSSSRKEIEKTDRRGMNRLLYPSKEIFIMEKGEKFLSGTFFDGNLSAYILWGAICNQFLNCRLSSIYSSDKLHLSSANFEETIQEIYYNELDFVASLWKLNDLSIDFSHSLSDYELFEYFNKFFFIHYETLIDNKKLTIPQKNKITYKIIELIGNPEALIKKQFYLKYLKSNIYFSLTFNFEEDREWITEEQAELILLFRQWNPFVELLEQNKEEIKTKFKLPNKVFPEFESLFHQMNMKENIENIRRKDVILSTNIFPFNDTFKRYKTNKQYVTGFYTLLINVLYNGILKPSTKNKKTINHYILEEIDFENSNLMNILHNRIPEFTL